MQIVVDGILTNYQVLGNKKDTILILHGWQRSLNEWLPIARTLSEKYKVILLDLPGFGLTPRPEKSYTIYDYSNFIEHFLSKIEVSKIMLIGHSFGGRIGIILAAKTHLLNKLFLVDSAAVETKSLGVKTKIRLNKLAALPIKIFMPHKVDTLKKKFGSDDYQNAGSMRDIFINTVNEDLTPLLKDIKTETVIIWGEKDVVRPLSEAKIIEQGIKNSVLRIVWSAGHSPYIDKPKEFLDILEENL